LRPLSRKPNGTEVRVLWLIIGGYFIFINVAAFGMFAIDKSAAEQGEWRIGEGTLLLAALIGGCVGAITAQQWLRHKTRKEPFRTTLYGIALLQIGGLIYLYLNGLPPALSQFANAIVNL
jgi:uncharacterized membrane protein YsdA (DUF1294 family)